MPERKTVKQRFGRRVNLGYSREQKRGDPRRGRSDTRIIRAICRRVSRCSRRKSQSVKPLAGVSCARISSVAMDFREQSRTSWRPRGSRRGALPNRFDRGANFKRTREGFGYRLWHFGNGDKRRLKLSELSSAASDAADSRFLQVAPHFQ